MKKRKKKFNENETHENNEENKKSKKQPPWHGISILMQHRHLFSFSSLLFGVRLIWHIAKAFIVWHNGLIIH